VIRQFSGFIRRYPLLIRLPYLIYRRFQPRYTIGVVGILINDQGQILIVEHVLHPENPWGLPGGWIGNNEEPAVAVVRELKEELELDAIAKQVIYVKKPSKNHIDIAFLCEASNSVGNISKELLDYRWTDPEQLPSLNIFHKTAIKLALNNLHRSKYGFNS
jgi:8-oxo-dGTP diphosphatase